MNKIETDKINKNGRVYTTKSLKRSLEVVDGEKYKNCCSWRFFAGNGFACFEMCSTKQQEACSEAQAKNRGKAATENKKL